MSTAKPLLPQQPLTARGDPPSREMVEVIQRIIADILEGEASAAALDGRIDALEAIEATNVTNAPGSAPRFFPRAWVTFAGATGVVAGSGNVGSVTRGSAGTYTVNFTSAAPNGSYVPTVLTDGGTIFAAYGARSTTNCVINTRNNAGVLTDPSTVSVAFFW